MTCALAGAPTEDGPYTREYLRETEGGTFVKHDWFLLATWEAVARVRARRIGNTNRRRIASPLVWHDAPQRTPLDAPAIPRCVFCGARHTHDGGEVCAGDALDFDDRNMEAL